MTAFCRAASIFRRGLARSSESGLGRKWFHSPLRRPNALAHLKRRASLSSARWTRHPLTLVTHIMKAVHTAACGAHLHFSAQAPPAGPGASLHRSAALRVSSMRPALATPFRVGHKKTHATSQTSAPCPTVTPLRVVCANPRRVQKVQQQMRREISNMLQTDKVRVHSVLRTTPVAPKP